LLCEEFGDSSTARLYSLHRLLQRATAGRARFVAYALYAQPVPCPALQAIRPAAGNVVRLAGPDDVLRPRFPRPAAVLTARWAAGSRCHVCEVDGDFAGFIWLSEYVHEEDEVGCRYRLPANGVWDFDVYLEPRYRLGRTLSRLWAAVDADLAARGVRWSFSRISRFNRASIATHERLGARCLGRASFLCLGRWQLAWLPGRRWPRMGRHAGEIVLNV
jgi:hypothetical protein